VAANTSSAAQTAETLLGTSEPHRPTARRAVKGGGPPRDIPLGLHQRARYEKVTDLSLDSWPGGRWTWLMASSA